MLLKTRGVVVFDRNIIKKKWGSMNADPISKAGLLVRKIARQSIRRRKKTGKPSSPGKPPKSIQPGNTPPFKQIYADTLGAAKTIVGMVGYGGNSNAPELMEHGGRTKRLIPRSRKRTTKERVVVKKRMVAQMVTYEPRPFMHPALRQAKAKLPKLWENSLH